MQTASEDVTILVERLVRRLRLVRTLEYFVRSGLAAAALLCLGLIWDKFLPLPLAAWRVLFIAAALLVVSGASAGFLRRISGLSAAKLADVRLRLDDRLSSSVAFSAGVHPTPFMLAHIAETASHLNRIRPGDAVPLRLPRRLPLLGVALLVLGLLLLMPGFDGRAVRIEKSDSPALPPMRLAGERTVEAMLLKVDAGRDPRLADVMQELKRLYADLHAGQLSREEALSRVGEVEARLSEIESERTEGRTAHTWRKELERALAEKGAALVKNPATAELGRAMAEAKLDEASEESRSLAEQAAGKAPALKLTPEQSKALAEVMRNAAAANERTLDVLSKDLDAAAGALTAEDLKKFAENLEKMAGELDRLREEMEKMKGLARTDDELEEMKEIVNALRQDGEGRWTLGLAGGNRPVGGYLQLDGVKPPEEGEAQPGVGDTPEGPGTGGEPTRMDVQRTLRALSGAWGDGASLIEVVRGAASEGQAFAPYRDVAEAAARYAEDAVHSEDIPLGYRFYIKRYFQLIRLRQGSGGQVRPPVDESKETP